MEEESNISKAETSHVEDKYFDEPLIMQGLINETEPQRYVAEKPYDLTRYEYRILKNPCNSEFWFNLSAGATAGVFLSIVGKSLSALINKLDPHLEIWELITLATGIVISIVMKKCYRTKDDLERVELTEVIDGHFKENKPRRLHLTKREQDEN